MNEDTRDHIIRAGLLIGMFIFLVLGILSLEMEPDFIFDRFFSAALFLLFFFVYKHLRLRIYQLIIGIIALTLHHLKLYGNVYVGLEFDMIMHFIGAFASSLIVYQYLSNCDGISCSNKMKTGLLAVLIVAGLGTFIEITEYFGYAKLPSGEGILHYGQGDEGDWADSVSDMMFNLLGAILGILITFLIHYRKRHNIRKIQSFLCSLFI